jgi:hypothetical protein
MAGRIVQFAASNVLRLKAFSFTPKTDENVIKLGGRNGAGKSSVLKLIAAAFGGAKAIPEDPIHGDESQGSVTLNLGDYVVTLRFWRSRKECNCGNAMRAGEAGVAYDAKQCVESCESREWDKTYNDITVKSPEGAKYPAPQTLLNKLHGKLTFDPMAFLDLDAPAQEQMLYKLLGIDVSAHDEKRALAYSARTELNRQLKTQSTLLQNMPEHADAPAQEISTSEVAAEVTRAQELKRAADTAEFDHKTAGSAFAQAGAREGEQQDLIKQLEARLVSERSKLTTLTAAREAAGEALKKATAAMETAKAAVPDAKALTDRLKQIEDTNNKVRANVARKSVANSVAQLELKVAEQSHAIAEAELAKRTLLESVEFPVDGLGLSETGITFNGKPFSQASDAERLRTSVALGLRMHPTLRVMLIRNGNLLDDDSMAILDEMAEAADAQVWMEYVTTDASEVSVLIEDGQVAKVNQ